MSKTTRRNAIAHQGKARTNVRTTSPATDSQKAPSAHGGIGRSLIYAFAIRRRNALNIPPGSSRWLYRKAYSSK